MSVNEDNIETLVGAANIANSQKDGPEEEKVTFKDEKADSNAVKNLCKANIGYNHHRENSKRNMKNDY